MLSSFHREIRASDINFFSLVGGVCVNAFPHAEPEVASINDVLSM